MGAVITNCAEPCHGELKGSKEPLHTTKDSGQTDDLMFQKLEQALGLNNFSMCEISVVRQA